MSTLDQQSPPVDWDKIHDDVLCPLCDYNLRGLPEPRCPECGYRFDWNDLIDPQRRRHPYLFEHHPKHKTWSFFKTLWGGLRPRKFWKSVHPAQPSHPWRLLSYWILANLGLLLLLLAVLVFVGIELTATMQMYRNRMNANYNQFAKNPNWNRQWPTRASFDQWLDANYPLPPSPQFFRLLLSSAQGRWAMMAISPLRAYRSPLHLSIGLSGLLLLWPWLTFLTLMIFRWSMRRARVRTIHVLRCVLYGSDVVFWFSLASLGTAIVGRTALIAMSNGVRSLVIDSGYIEIACLLAMLLYLVLFSYRLTLAYSRYLKFNHCLATVLASQIIIALAIPTFLLVWSLSA